MRFRDLTHLVKKSKVILSIAAQSFQAGLVGVGYIERALILCPKHCNLYELDIHEIDKEMKTFQYYLGVFPYTQHQHMSVSQLIELNQTAGFINFVYFTE